MENKTFIQLNTLPTGYNGFAMTADFPCSEEDFEQAKQKIIRWNTWSYRWRTGIGTVSDVQENKIQIVAEDFWTSSQKDNATV